MTEAATPLTPATGQDREDDLVFPPDDLSSLLDLARFLEARPEPGLLIGPDNERIPLPPEVDRVLRHAVDVMRQGKAALIAPQSLLLTTQETADLLGVSRPTVVKLLENGAIPFDQPNRHRRVRLQDVLDFRERRHAEQRAALDQLVEETSALGLYEGTAADYTPALQAARSRRAATERTGGSTMMSCPNCKSMLLHRAEPPPLADRCTSAACGRVYDPTGAESPDDPGPWPTQPEMDDLQGLRGSFVMQDEHGSAVASWTYRRGSSVTLP